MDRSQDGAQIHRARPGAAGLWSAQNRERDGAVRSGLICGSGYPGLTATRLLREIHDPRAGLWRRLYRGDRLPARGAAAAGNLIRGTLRDPPGEQAQVDFAQFEVVFTDEPGAVRKVLLFSLVLGYSRLIWARFVAHQDLQTVLHCHMAAFAALGGVPRPPNPLRQDEDRGDRRE
jgi:Integrase core domain